MSNHPLFSHAITEWNREGGNDQTSEIDRLDAWDIELARHFFEAGVAAGHTEAVTIAPRLVLAAAFVAAMLPVRMRSAAPQALTGQDQTEMAQGAISLADTLIYEAKTMPAYQGPDAPTNHTTPEK